MEDLRKKLGATECQRDILNKENTRLREQLDNINKNCEEKVEQIKQVQRKSESCDKLQLDRLQFELDLINKKYEEAKATLVDLDAQCERLMQKLRKCEFERNSYKNDYEQLRAESGKLRSENSEFRKLQSENLSLKSNEKFWKEKLLFWSLNLKNHVLPCKTNLKFCLVKNYRNLPPHNLMQLKREK
uniref:Uncharacterized protein n=1 Tax=Meloidogyne enterolobii TaxID=390850 RepID=A0A6V7TJL8_MELEN|nr:unnamed protein product [Meloidogyne enterolobii]